MLGNLNINENKIIGVISEFESHRQSFCDVIIKKYNASILSLDKLEFLFGEKVIDELNKYADKNTDKYKKRLDEVLLMVDLDNNLLERDISLLSNSEVIKLLFAQILLKNPNTIIIEDIFTQLDIKTRNKFFKILIKLKKYYNKTIIIFSFDINNVYELLDDIIYIDSNGEYIYDNKFSLYENNNIEIKPDIINFTNMMRKKYTNMKYTDSINELIKELYREIR